VNVTKTELKFWLLTAGEGRIEDPSEAAALWRWLGAQQSIGQPASLMPAETDFAGGAPP